jgi:hypothetical protein
MNVTETLWKLTEHIFEQELGYYKKQREGNVGQFTATLPNYGAVHVDVNVNRATILVSTEAGEELDEIDISIYFR